MHKRLVNKYIVHKYFAQLLHIAVNLQSEVGKKCNRD